MATAPQAPPENDRRDEALFPSGPWRGFYVYGRGPERHRMEMGLTFRDGQVSGDGLDDIGPFRIRGTFSASDLEVRWVKTYVGKHSVDYRGFREGSGIWGTWVISAVDRGGFRIWPTASGEMLAEHEALSIPLVLTQPAPTAPGKLPREL